MLTNTPFSDSTTRFSSKAEVYAKARPRYPASVVVFLESHGVLHPGDIIVDIGSGTGLSAQPFLESGYAVTGIEPNDAMRMEGDSVLSHHSRFHSVKGTAELTTLPERSVSVAIAGQAFHWFDIEKTRYEMQRILQPPGWFIAMWNHRRHDANPLQAGYEAILHKYCPDYPQLAKLYRSPQRSTAFFPAGYQDATLPNPQQLNWEVFEARVLSASYIPKSNQADFTPFMTDMKQLYDHHAVNGYVQFDLEIWIHWGKLL